jgi:hypothetical protein
MNKKDEEIKTLYNIVDKLEKRIFLLEKVLDSHAKCIGEMRENKSCELTASEYISITEEDKNDNN